MKCPPLLALAVALSLAATLASAQAEERPMLPEVRALWASHEAAQKIVVADRDKKLANLDYIYMLNVDKLKNDRAAAGDLDGALAAKTELDRLSAHQALTDEQRKAMNPALQPLRASYDAALKGYHDEAAKQNAALLQKLLADLEALQTRITTTGDLDKALRVKAEKERIAAGEARAEPAPVSRPVAPTPAPVTEQPRPPAPTPSPKIAATPSATPAEGNLIKNGNFENGTDGWELFADAKKAKLSVDSQELHNGKPTLRIDSAEADHSFFNQKVTVKPHTRYQFSGYIKTQNVESVKPGSKEGARLTWGNVKTPPLDKTKGWTRMNMYFATRDVTEIQLGGCLGHFSDFMTGTAWFSDLSLTER